MILILFLAILTAGEFRHTTSQPAGKPVLVATQLPEAFNPDSMRVTAAGGGAPRPAKVDWRVPNARISFVSGGAGEYVISYEESAAGQRTAEPAMIGAGDRVTYGVAGVRGKLAVGLWAHPVGVDMDEDGDTDIIVACVDRPYNGTYYFRNIGSNERPLFDRAVWMGRGYKDLVAADFNGDGRVDVVSSGIWFSDVRRNRLSKPAKIPLKRTYHVGRDDLWFPVDWDRDGKIDVLVGTSDWRDYGWDDAYNEKGEWMRGPLHGYVWLHRNMGSNENPEYAEPVKLQAAGRDIDLYGSPAPNPVDWLGTGKWDLIGGSFLDTVTLFRNAGAGLGGGVPLPFKMDLCMIQPRVASWHRDGRPSLLVGEEDGVVAFFENLAARGQEPRFAPVRYLEQVDPYLKSGALSRPVAVDWNGDGKLDLITGNSGGYIQYFENIGEKGRPAFADRGYLKAEGKVIRRIAGPNGSVQGPAEEKWGYSNPSVADWDLDGKLDILVNDIWGDVVWYRDTGAGLAAAQPVEVEWPGAPPKPDWVWWQPKPKQLLTQWRTTPKVVDWDRDGLPDLVMLNHQGYLSLFRRARVNGALRLGAPERIFVDAGGRFLNMAAGRAGRSGRRKVELADWDSDGDLDLITDSDEGPVWYENTGTQARPVMQLRGTIIKANLAGHSPTPNVADWDGDGRLDVLVGAEDGFLYYFERSFIDGKR